MRRWSWLVAFLLVASACGGGDSGGATAATGGSDSAVSSQGAAATGASPVAVVESGDGLASLAVPAGSLPEGVSPDDIHLEALFTDADDGATLIVAVQLLPDGLTLGEPASLTIALPEPPEGALMAILSSGDSIEFLDGQTSQVDGAFSITTAIEHFSVLNIIYPPFTTFRTELWLDPVTVDEGEPQSGHASGLILAAPFDLVISFGSDGWGSARVVRFSAQGPFEFTQGRIIHSEVFAKWEPALYFVDVNSESSYDDPSFGPAYGWETSARASECTERNDYNGAFSMTVSFRVTVGDPESGPLGRPVSVPTNLNMVSSGDFALEVGDTVPATALLSTVATSDCTVEEESETDTGSETPPATKAPEQVRLPEPLASSCGILGFEDLGGGEYTVTLNGDCQTAVEGFYDFAATVERTDAQWGRSSDSGIRDLFTFRVLNGEVIISAYEFDQSKAVDGSIDGVPISGDAEWAASNQITFRTPDTPLLDSEPSVLVWIRETEDSEQLNERYP